MANISYQPDPPPEMNPVQRRYLENEFRKIQQTLTLVVKVLESYQQRITDLEGP